MAPEILLITTLRSLAEVAAFMLALRGLMWAFGERARKHFVYGIFTAGSMPFIRFARAVSPRVVQDRYVPLVAFVLLASVWIALVVGAQTLCARPGTHCV